MKRDVSLWQFGGYVFTVLGGTLLHFLYDWTGENYIAAVFSGVNESTWEHMKLLYFPLVLFALIQSRFFKEYEEFWCVKLIGLLTGLLLIPVLFYTYNGAIGHSPDWVNITIFFVSAAATFAIETRLIKNRTLLCRSPRTACIVIALIGVSFAVFTFFTPPIGLFRDPVTGTYGLNG